MTYNVNFGLGGDPRGVAAIREADVDVVLLQETNEAWESALRAELGDRYPFMRFWHAGAAGGLAILSRVPVLDRGTSLPRGAWFAASRVIVRAPLGPVQILNVHLRPGVSDGGSWVSGAWTTPRVRLREIRAHARTLDRSLPTLVVGDLNEGPGGHAVRALEARGMTDVLPEYASSATTWRYPTSVGTLRLQLDHILYDGTLRPLTARVVRTGPSDHFPVVATFVRAALPSPRSRSR
jgi:endonuclease/exonuclease/phosphatase (EEP) superfamily protein YafD